MSGLVPLLPHRSTDLEIAVVEVMDSRSRIRERISRIIGARHDETIDPILLPWLLRDWGLEEAAAFVEDWQLLYREGKAWQRERGTLAALDRALAWLGQAGAGIEEIMPGSPRWAEFQIALPTVPGRLDPLGNIIGLSRLSAGSRSILDRVHAGFDMRAARPDFTVLDGGLLDFDSGVRLRKDWPILSFGRREEHSVDATKTRDVLQFEMTRRDVGFARYVDDLMLDWSVPDDQRPSIFRPFDTGVVSNFELEAGARRDQFLDSHRIIKAAIIPDRQWPVESLQAVFPGCDRVPTGKPWLADGFALDTDTFWFRLVPIEAIIEAVYRDTADLRGARLEGFVPILSSTVNMRVRRGWEADETRLDLTASEPIPELQTFSHVIGGIVNEVASEDLALAAHAVFKAGIRFDHGPPVESLQAVFTGGEPRPYGRPWIADGFRPSEDTFWHRSTPIREILSARETGEPTPLPPGSARAVARVSLGGGARIESRIVEGAATLLTSFEVGTVSYDGQSWVDLVPPEEATWDDLHVLIGTSVNGDSDG